MPNKKDPAMKVYKLSIFGVKKLRAFFGLHKYLIFIEIYSCGKFLLLENCFALSAKTNEISLIILSEHAKNSELSSHLIRVLYGTTYFLNQFNFRCQDILF